MSKETIADATVPLKVNWSNDSFIEIPICEKLKPETPADNSLRSSCFKDVKILSALIQ